MSHVMSKACQLRSSRQPVGVGQSKTSPCGQLAVRDPTSTQGDLMGPDIDKYVGVGQRTTCMHCATWLKTTRVTLARLGSCEAYFHYFQYQYLVSTTRSLFSLANLYLHHPTRSTDHEGSDKKAAVRPTTPESKLHLSSARER